MAPTLSSSAFITPQHSLTLRNQRLSVHAAKNGAAGSFPSFRLGKLGAGSSSEDEASQGSDSGNSTPFSFNFGKLSSDAKSLIPALPKPASGLSFGQLRKKDAGTVFVAGATGQAGIRIAQTLLREGFSVRAGVPDLGSAQELARLAAAYKLISNEESKRLNAVQSTFIDAESIAKAIGNAGKVVVTIGSEENGPAGEVTPSDALKVIEAAQLAGVSHVAIVYDKSISNASTYNVLDGIQSFFTNIFSRSQPLTITEFLQKVVATDLSYTLIKTKLADDYSPEGSFNVVVSAEGSANDYKVSTSKIASLVANVFSNISVAENKVVEVSSDPSAPSKSANELFSAIPEDGRRKAYLEALEKAKREELERKATEEAVVKAAKKKEEKVKKIKEEEPEEVESNGGVSVESLLGKAKVFGSGLSWEKFSSQLTVAAQKQVDEKPKAQIATVRGQAKARNLPSKKAVIKQQPPPPPAPRISVFSRPKPEPKAQPAEEKKEVRKVFGGLFKQETIYVDDV